MIKRALLFVFLCLLLCSCKSIDISKALDMGFTTVQATSQASRPISDEEEYYIGRAVAARIFVSYPLLKNQNLTKYINTIGRVIALHSEKPFTYGGYHFAILNTNEINAFACPGGTILITRGMIELAQNEEELASILAHEIAHINHRDGINSIKQARWTEALTIIGTKALKEYGPAELSNLVSIFEGSIDDVFKTLVVNGYGRTQEYSADETAVLYLSKAGYDPYALISVLERLNQFGKKGGGGIIKTHPETIDRIENLKNKIPPAQIDSNIIHYRAQRFKSFISAR
ncbi:MAG TPA: M48 family metalloprotease [Syntrophorhabdaceae bacterium]|nr:M48 family metalloprotease [Syntrophorhabdaceae bacterium]